MWRKILRAVGVIFGLGVILAYTLYASHLANLHRSKQQISNVVIELSDSSATQQLTSSARIYDQLKRGGVKIKNRAIDSVDAVGIARLIERNGFVEEAKVYTTYSGNLHIAISERAPLVRLRVAGYDSFVTSEGYIFRAPQGSACYTSVMTGGYRPPFSSTFEGYFSTLRKERHEAWQKRLGKLYAEYQEVKSNQRELRKEKNSLLKQRKRKIFEKKEDHELRKKGIATKVAEIEGKQRKVVQKVKSIEATQRRLVAREEREYRRFDDFERLVAFVNMVQNDSFWGAEIVQIEADTTSLGAISLLLIPRSGDFVVNFGTLDNTVEKLNKLRTFYDNGLSRLGWERYKRIDVRYNKQVICTE
jgi:hypothetical protein